MLGEAVRAGLYTLAPFGCSEIQVPLLQSLTTFYFWESGLKAMSPIYLNSLSALMKLHG